MSTLHAVYADAYTEFPQHVAHESTAGRPHSPSRIVRFATMTALGTRSLLAALVADPPAAAGVLAVAR